MSHATTESHDTHSNTVARLSDRTWSANVKTSQCGGSQAPFCRLANKVSSIHGLGLFVMDRGVYEK